MSGPDTPDAPPPVPEEFAATYAEAYRRALESGEYGELDTGIHPVVVDPAQLDALITEVDPQQVHEVGTHRPGGPIAGLREEPWFLPVVAVLAAVLLIGAAYGLGRAIAGGGDQSPGSTTGTVPSTAGHPGQLPQSRPPSTPAGVAGDLYSGPQAPVSADDAKASCTAGPAVDAAGHRVQYHARNTLDGDPATAWRCNSDAIGETLRFRFGDAVPVVQVGLVPGYAKTDPLSGADRYAENNRITRVRWTLADGISYVQQLDPAPTDRSVQWLRVPRTLTDRITLTILAVAHGPRDTTAISTVAFEQARS